MGVKREDTFAPGSRNNGQIMHWISKKKEQSTSFILIGFWHRSRLKVSVTVAGARFVCGCRCNYAIRWNALSNSTTNTCYSNGYYTSFLTPKNIVLSTFHRFSYLFDFRLWFHDSFSFLQVLSFFSFSLSLSTCF